MLTCAVVFFWDCRPRETISGLLGRWKVHGNRAQRAFSGPAAWLVDRLYWWEPDHCVAVFHEELAARRQLYQDWPHP